MVYKLTVISDVHYDVNRLRRIMPIINSSDYLVFCGDGLFNLLTVRGEILVPTICVRGNCDREPNVMNIADLAGVTLGNTRVFVTHGHKQDVKHGISGLLAAAQVKRSSLVFFGHTHSFYDGSVGGIHFINPGALCAGSYALVLGDGANFTCKQEFVL